LSERKIGDVTKIRTVLFLNVQSPESFSLHETTEFNGLSRVLRETHFLRSKNFRVWACRIIDAMDFKDF
jgi:hypothetical protein